MSAPAELPDEFVLVAACCGWPASPARDAAVAAAARRITDWDRVLRVVSRHRVEGLVHAALVRAGVQMPPEKAQALSARAQHIAARSLANAIESVRLQALFDETQIPLLVMKGASLAQLGYGTLAIKQSKDIDLLSSPEQADAAVRLLEQRGYELHQPAVLLNAQQRRDTFRYGREMALRHPLSGAQVELRWRLVESPPLLKGVDVHSASQNVTLPGIGVVRTFQDDDLFAYLCLHGAAHGWSRLKWLADVNALLASKSDAEVLHLYEHSQARGTGVCAGLALLLCQRVLGRELPPRLAQPLNTSIRLRVLTALTLNLMIGADATKDLKDRPFGTTRVALMQFMLGGGWRNVVAQARVMSIRLDDIIRCPLPVPLHFLYPLLRLPLWLWRRGSA